MINKRTGRGGEGTRYSGTPGIIPSEPPELHSPTPGRRNAESATEGSATGAGTQGVPPVNGSVTIDSTPPGLYIKLKVNDNECIALLDTGASLSIIEKTLTNHVISNEGKRMHIAGGKTITTLGSSEVVVDINHKSCIHKMQVVNKVVSTASCIIGLDLINAMNIDILCYKKQSPVVLINGQTVKLLNSIELQNILEPNRKDRQITGSVTENIINPKNRSVTDHTATLHDNLIHFYRNNPHLIFI